VNVSVATAGSHRVQWEGEKPAFSSEGVARIKGCPSVSSESAPHIPGHDAVNPARPSAPYLEARKSLFCSRRGGSFSPPLKCEEPSEGVLASEHSYGPHL
jgi:hypothetical protein